ncbi:MAG TPA: hypothetical protein VJV78_45610 [Polyangiales bacterium]|nr:hypothetical protein [Polyangiales bacterium]
MGITAIALLRIPRLPAVGGRVKALEDGFLLDTGESFATDPEELAGIVREQLGELASEHDDERGIFFLPDVAAPSARSYEAVIAEVGEGGVWGPVPSEASPLGAAFAGGGLGALLGSLMQQLPSGVLDTAAAAARGEPGAFEAASAQLQAAAGSGQLDVTRLGAMLESSGIDMAAMQQLMGEMQSALTRDPAATAALAEKLFGQAAGDDEDDDDTKR